MSFSLNVIHRSANQLMILVLHVARARATWCMKHADWLSCNVIFLKCHLTCLSDRGITMFTNAQNPAYQESEKKKPQLSFHVRQKGQQYQTLVGSRMIQNINVYLVAL